MRKYELNILGQWNGSLKGNGWRARRSFTRSLVPGVGIEPTTRSSSGFRSTTELPRQ